MASIFIAGLSFFFIASTYTSYSHPLDSLTPSEISEVAAIIKGSQLGSYQNLTFHYIGLHEPSKQAVLLWLSNSTKKPPSRQAFIVAQANEQTYEIISHTPFIESINQRRLDIKEVDFGVFTVGWFGEKGQGRRMVSILSFYKDGSPNIWVRPIEGITMLVDLDKMSIIEYSDRQVVPVPKAEGTDYRASELKPPFAAQTKPITIIQPDGPSFKIDGQE
ncbi:hypothetical protein F0562_035007 [Nyssa sinensis]|uniref:Amine oxidase n=1 Tax=Nyssa sinensis TaxID=561372 RepID=A0A5J5ABY3_9ASTE|nr:hypothetical protein F0562_035007 [Nyssa sinensis]